MHIQIYMDDIAMHNVFRMSKATALLPLNKIIEKFKIIKSQATLSPNPQIENRFLLYLQSQLIERELIIFVVSNLNNIKMY